MTEQEILENLQEIFQNIFDDEELVISRATTPESIEDWDSLEQINIVMQIDKKFHVKFSMNEAADLYSVGLMVDAIQNKVSKES